MTKGRMGRFKAGKQTVVYWGNPQSDGATGRTFDNPVELDPDDGNGVRWEQKQELFLTAAGQEKLSNAIVYVAQDVVVGGYLYLGTLADLGSAEEDDPQSVEAAYEIRAFKKIPDWRGDLYLRKVWL